MMCKVILCGGEPTLNDLQELDDFRALLLVLSQGKDMGLSPSKAMSYACTEVYGDKFGEGSRRKDGTA